VVFSLNSFPKRWVSSSCTVNFITVLLESTTNMATVATHVVGKNPVGCNLIKTKSIFIVALAHSSQNQKPTNSFLPFKVSKNWRTEFENVDKIKLAQPALLYLQISEKWMSIFSVPKSYQLTGGLNSILWKIFHFQVFRVTTKKIIMTTF
jgi:hypothetical protein